MSDAAWLCLGSSASWLWPNPSMPAPTSAADEDRNDRRFMHIRILSLHIVLSVDLKKEPCLRWRAFRGWKHARWFGRAVAGSPPFRRILDCGLGRVNEPA